MAYNQNSGAGQAILANLYSQIGVFGNVHVVMNSANTDEANYQAMQDLFPVTDGGVRFFTSLESAYAAVESNNNDIILLDANSTHEIALGLAVTKSRVHFIGMDGGDRLLQQGAKVQLATASASAYVLKNTGTRNSFKNIKFIQAATAATGLHVLEEGGEGTLVKNCSFTFGVADNLDLTTATEALFGGDSCTYINTTFGQDTLLSSATTRSIMTIDQVNGFAAKSNVFVDCTWIGASSDADLQCISMAAAGDVLFTNHFIRPSLIASISAGQGAIQCTKAVSTANGLVNGTVLISYPMCHGFADLGINGTNNDQLLVASPLMVTTDLVGIAPTAT